MADSVGYVAAALPGLAKRAGVSIEKTQEAITKFEAPDKHSRSEEFEGRRISKVDGGWILLNHQKYRDLRNEEERREYMKNYMHEYRARTKTVNNSVNNVNKCKQMLAQADTDTEADKKEAVALLPSLSNKENMEKTVKAGEMALKAHLNTSPKKSLQKWENQPIAREWRREFEKFFSKPYVWVKGDDQGVSTLNSSRVSKEEIVDVIRSTWENKDGYWFDKVNTIGFFANKFNDLRSDHENHRKRSTSQRGAISGPSGCFLED